jgi:endoglucanase
VNGVKYKFGENEAALSLDHFADVWKKLATVFKKYKNIFGYDIMNEPYGLTPGIWAQAAQKAIDAIREVDTTTPIVIEGESYASARTWMTNGAKLATQLTDPSNNLIWQAHCYFDKNSSGLYELGSYDDEVYRATPALQRLKPFVDWLNENNFKGIVGEFGVPRNDARWLKMLDEVCTYLKENKVNATYWVAGTGYANDQVSVQPLKDYTQERAQMRVLSKYFNVESEELPTSISNVTRQPKVAGTDAIYTLQGVKVPSQQKLAPGIYIQGGKKILVTK